MNMFDPNFDPLEKLELLESNLIQIAQAFNSQAERLNFLNSQNKHLKELIKQDRIELRRLNAELLLVKQQQQSGPVNYTNYSNH